MTKDDVLDKACSVSGPGGRRDYAGNLYDIADQLPENCRILEIGAQFGGSGVLMALTVKDRGGVVYSVDPGFVPVKKRPKYYEDFPILATLAQYMETAEKFGCEDIMFPLAGTSVEVIPRWPEERLLDLVFIDGDHTYECVKQDMQWLQFTKFGSMVALDDWIEPVRDACEEYLKDHPEWELVTETIPRCYKHG